MNKGVYIAYGLVWLSMALVVSVAIYVSKSISPLWGMIIPTFVSITYEKK